MAQPRSHEPAADPALDQVHPDNLLAAVQGGRDEPGNDLAVASPNGAMALAGTPLAAFAGNEWDGVESGLENWEHIGFTLPRIVSDMRPGGGWYDEVADPEGKTPVQEMALIVLAAMPARAWWEGDFDGTSGAPDCRSTDMVVPDPASPKPQATTCARCPLSQWSPDGEAPACRERINALVYLPESGEIRRLTVSGTSVRHFRRYVSALQARAARLPVFAQVTEFSIEQISKDGMKWLEAHFAPGDPVDPRLAVGTLLPLQREVSAAWRSMIAADLASAEADGTAVARDGVIDVEEPF